MAHFDTLPNLDPALFNIPSPESLRSEERRVGKECER